MSISNDLASQFAKMTNDDKSKKSEATVYGTTVQYNGKTYVKIDGSDLLTPVETTADIKEDERVTVLIKDHNAVVTGNITDPSASSAKVDKIEWDINVNSAFIENLEAQYAAIETLVNGNLTTDNIQSLNLTSDKVTVDDAFITDAMIESINANKMNAGSINTNNVSIQSEDGSMILSGSTQQFKDQNGKVRIQIGKDAEGNFTFCLFSQDGVGILLDEDGIKSGAVPDGLIINDMVADGANISGSKLDISSVITQINDNETTIKSDKIYFDETEQSLEVAFNQLKTTVESIEDITIDADLLSVIEQVSTNTTNMEIIRGQINSLISNTTITKQDGTVVQMKDEFNSVKNTVESHTQTIGSLTTDLDSVETKQTELEQNLDGFKTIVSETYATKESVEDVDDKFSNYPTTTQMNSAINQKADEITAMVSTTYTTKTEFDNLKIGGTNLLVNSDFRNSKNDWAVSNSGSFNIYTQDTYNTGFTDIADKCVIVTGTTANAFLYQGVTLEPNTQYTLSAWVYSNSDYTPKLGAWYVNNGWLGIIQNPITPYTKGTWARYSATFTTNGTYTTTVVGIGFGNAATGEICHIMLPKLEKGNKATDWSPAPSDIDDDIQEVADNLATNYSTTTEMNSAINQKANEITSTVSETYATKTTVNDLSNNLETNYSTTTEMNSAINQKADEITSSVSETYVTQDTFNSLSLETGGAVNYLPYTNFNKDILSKWYKQTNTSQDIVPYNFGVGLSTDAHILGDMVLRYRYDIETVIAEGLTYKMFRQDDTITLEKNTIYTMSCWIYQASSCSEASFRVYPVLEDGSLGGRLTLKATSGYIGGFEYVTTTFTTPDTTTEYSVRFYSYCDSTKTGNCDMLIYHPMINKGAVASDWTESTVDTDYIISTNYATKSELSQTSTALTATFTESGGYNLIRNSTGLGGTSCWTTNSTISTSTSGSTKLPVKTTMYVQNSTTSELYAYSTRFALKAETTYTFSGWLLTNANCVSLDVWALLSTSVTDSDAGTSYTNAIQLEATVNTGTAWKYFTATFTTPKNTKSGILRIDNNASTASGTSGRAYWNTVMLHEGSVALPWSPHPNELYTTHIQMDKNGLMVLQGENFTILDEESLAFYTDLGLVKYGEIKDGKLYYTSDTGTAVGHVGRTIWSSSGKYLTALNAEYGHTACIGARQTTTGDYITSMVASSTAGNHSGQRWYHQGLNILGAYVSGALYFRNPGTGNVSPMPGAVWNPDDASQCVGGKSSVRLCIGDNTNGYTTKFYVDSAGAQYASDISMNGYSINNASVTSEVSAQSTQTYSLRDSGSIEQKIYAPMSFTEGELRYVYREPCSTMESYEYNEETDEWSIQEGVYTCYCELPLFMAENIEANYHINIGKIGWGDYRIKEKTQYYFILESEQDGFAFTWEVVGKQIEQANTNNVVVANTGVVTVDNPTIEPEIIPPEIVAE